MHSRVRADVWRRAQGGPPAWMLPFIPARFAPSVELTSPVDIALLDEYQMGAYARASAPAAVALGAALDLLRYVHMF